jgi:hypothetical protein
LARAAGAFQESISMMNSPSSNPCIDDVAAAAEPASAPTAHTTRSAWLAVGSIAVGTFAMVSTEFMPIGLLTDIARGLGVRRHGRPDDHDARRAGRLRRPALIVASGRLDRRTVLIAAHAAADRCRTCSPRFAPNFGT